MMTDVHPRELEIYRTPNGRERLHRMVEMHLRDRNTRQENSISTLTMFERAT